MNEFIRIPYVRVLSRYGLIGGVLGFGLLLVLYYLNRHPFLVPVFFDFRILLFSIFILLGLKEVRDYRQQGILYFWQGMIGALIFTILYALIASLLLWGFALLTPDFVTSYIRLFEDQVGRYPPEVIDQIGREAYDSSLAALANTQASDLAFLYLRQSFIISFFLSIIISVILRRQPKIS